MASTRSSQTKRQTGQGYARSRPEGRSPVLERSSRSPEGRPTENAESALRRTRRILEELFGPVPTRSFSVRFWNETVDRPPDEPEFVLVLRHPGALREMLLPPTQAAMGAAYARGHVDIEGDMEAAAAVADRAAKRIRRPATLLGLMARAARLPRDRAPGGTGPFSGGTPRGSRHSRERDAAAVRGHYDVGNDFYRLFLDQRMVYSCAYFAHADDDLDSAQEAKLDLICRKLRLRPGERLLDIGCGWGALVMHAAERFGVDALGITLSERQAALARERIETAGLSARCTIRVVDYRDLPEDAQFDKISSVGMVEHVGGCRPTSAWPSDT